MQSIVRHHIIRYACGCTTTRIEVGREPIETVPACAGHLQQATREEQITEFIANHDSDDNVFLSFRGGEPDEESLSNNQVDLRKGIPRIRRMTE